MPRQNLHKHTRQGVDLEIESWGGEYIQLFYKRDDSSIMLLLDEIDPLIEALQEAKEAQERPHKERSDRDRLIKWNDVQSYQELPY